MVGPLSVRVVLDTNILISALMTPNGIGAQIIDAWSSDRFTILSHDLWLSEIRSVTRRPRIAERIRRIDAARLVNRLARSCERIDNIAKVVRSADPFDDFLLGIAETGRADWLITGDKAGLLVLQHHGITQIITARAFHTMLRL
jgi:putative PIN family toxin of toxin-antitoxin system